MIALRILPFPFLFAFLACMAATAMSAQLPTDASALGTTDHNMHMRATQIQANSHVGNDETLQKVEDFRFPPAPNFEDQAWNLAQTNGGRHVAVLNPRMGRKSVYFFSAIKGSDSLGSQIGLGHDKVAALLWKYYPRGKSHKLVHVGVFHKSPHITWDLDAFEEAIKHH